MKAEEPKGEVGCNPEAVVEPMSEAVNPEEIAAADETSARQDAIARELPGYPTPRERLVGVFELQGHSFAEPVTHPEELAEQLVVLFDGAGISAWLDAKPSTVKTTRAVAEALVDAATS